MSFPIMTVRRDGWGGWDSYGDRVLAYEVFEAEDYEREVADRRFAAWKRRNERNN